MKLTHLWRYIASKCTSIMQKGTRLLSPTKDEGELIHEIRATISKLPDLMEESNIQTENTWRNNMNRLRELVLNSTPRTFLRGDVISETILVPDAEYMSSEHKKTIEHFQGFV